MITIFISKILVLLKKDYFEIEGELKISIKDLFKLNNEWYNNY